MPPIFKASENGSRLSPLPTTRSSETQEKGTVERAVSPLTDSKGSSSMNSAIGTITPTDEQSLVSAVRVLSGSQVGIWVKYSDVRKYFNVGRRSLHSTSSFASIVKSACKGGLIDQVRIDGGDFISLTVRGAGSKDPAFNPSHVNGSPTQPADLTLDPKPSSQRIDVRNSPLSRFIAPVPAAEDYPTEFHPLMRIVISMSKGPLQPLLNYLEVRQWIGNNNTIKAMGWPSFTQLVKAACERGYIKQITLSSDTFISLIPHPMYSQASEQRPPTISSSRWTMNNGNPFASILFIPLVQSTYSDSAQWSQTPWEMLRDALRKTTTKRLENYPENHQRLMLVIILLSGGHPGVTVKYEDVRSHIGTKSEIKKFGWSSFTSWVKSACDEGFIQTGGTDDSQWIMLRSKANPFKFGDLPIF
ncbi:hypothetical protein FS842_002758 [Serendipita sp. 407]|nr:hypothetical protein FS842_002758 [Serendipita sp. 407]